jgi:hypothetical protein
MTKTIVNLTEPIVVQEIEDTLSTYPYQPYQQAFAIPDLRQKLIAYVMTRSQVSYTVVDSEAVFNPNAIHASIEERLQMEALIRQGIDQILQEDAEWTIRHLPQVIYQTPAPSSWFG